jgi:predicted nucleic acid-binding protein
VRFLDTNIIVRYLTRDDPEKAEASFALLLRVERGEEVVMSSDLVISETVYVLSSRRYGLSRQRIRDLLDPLISLRSFRLPRKSLYPRIWELYCQRNIGFADAYNAAYMEARGVNEVYSYDADFDRVEGIRRVEPEA